ncbi:hypothetical protein HYN59_17235 [Flavobacterium album]|uniref:Uncharacterized protein n=1 Tax=Flavobacterium album TaxID=2175091 RepID=A0A2S1R274_9FLAO|nr:hypothetical protein HYN59_17235 [Flavobacterium album]
MHIIKLRIPAAKQQTSVHQKFGIWNLRFGAYLKFCDLIFGILNLTFGLIKTVRLWFINLG